MTKVGNNVGDRQSLVNQFTTGSDRTPSSTCSGQYKNVDNSDTRTGCKIDCLLQLRAQVERCRKCFTSTRATSKPIFGTGNINADLMVIAEFPPHKAQSKIQPFTGQEWELLRELLGVAGVHPDMAYYTTAIKCKPTVPSKYVPSNDGVLFAKYAFACQEYLAQQIVTIKPTLILAMGTLTLEVLFGLKSVNISKTRGQWFEWNSIPVLATYSLPGVMQSNSFSTKKNFADDLLKAVEKLGVTFTKSHRAAIRNKMLELINRIHPVK